jgi:hypothetical protein
MAAKRDADMDELLESMIYDYSHDQPIGIEINPITKDQLSARLQKFSDVSEGKKQFEKEDLCGVSRYNYLGICSDTSYTWKVPVLIGENTRDFIFSWVDDKYGIPHILFINLEFEDGRSRDFNSFQEMIDFVRDL